MPTVRLIGPSQRAYAAKLIAEAPQGHVMKISPESRSDRQNRLMWPHIADIQAQVPECAVFSAEDMKLRFMHSLGKEMRFLPELEGGGVFPVGQRSSTLNVAQFTALIDLIRMFGDKHDVRWTAPAEYQ